jgi:hypothetical protein
MDRMTPKPMIKPLFWTAFIFAAFIGCLMLVFLSMTVGTAYSVSTWLTSTPQVSALIYRTQTVNATELAIAQPSATLPQPPQSSPTPLQAATTALPPVTQTPGPTLEVTPEATQPVAPTDVPVTATVDALAVKQTEEAQLTPMAAEMQDVVNNLYNNQIIKSNSGSFFHLPDYSGQSNDPSTYKFTSTGLALSDFILSADMNWQVDNLAGEWADSGCGIVFRADEMGNYYMIYLSLDGRGRMVRKMDGSTVLLGRSTIYDVDRNNGQAKFMLIVEGDRVRYFVNDKVKFDKYGQPQIGKLEWTVVSGNKFGFGTQCQISNIKVWKLGSNQ